ncbi:MAG: hypothetical protein Kow0090_00190 [Myxococcota bacterium]
MSKRSAETENTLVASIERGEISPFYIIHSADDFLASKLAEKIALLIIPEKERSLNLVRYDGESVEMKDIIGDLNSYAFFPVRKVVWVQNANLGATKSDFASPLRAALAALKGGRIKIAVKKLSLALKRAGDDPSLLIGSDEEKRKKLLANTLSAQLTSGELNELAQAAEILNSEPELAAVSDDSPLETLARAAEKGWQKDNVLVVSSTKLDSRLKIVKELSEKGKVFHIEATTSAGSFGFDEDSAKAMISSVSREKGTNFASDAVEALIERIDISQSRLLENEIEKLAVYANGETVSREMVESLVPCLREDPFYEVVGDFVEKRTSAVLKRLAALFGGNERQEEVALPLLGALAAEYRRLLRARVFLNSLEGKAFNPHMSFPQFLSLVVAKLPEGGCEITGAQTKPKPGYLMHIFKRALQYSEDELKQVLIELHNTDVKLKTSSLPPKTAIERFAFNQSKQRRAGENNQG